MMIYEKNMMIYLKKYIVLSKIIYHQILLNLN